MKQFLFIPLLLLLVYAQAQNPSSNPGTLPAIIPPSPEVASLSNIGNLSTGLHTGSANVSIPLYELSTGSIKVPIALSYSTNGTRTNDIPSRVGLGWNLIAGGSVSRVIHDEEDGGLGVSSLAAPDFNQPSQQVLDYLNEAVMDNFDTEADEYSFSANGMSGKFFIGSDGQIHFADHNNFEMIKVGNGFKLTTADGIVYNFTLQEVTSEVRTNGNPRAHKVNTTSWFLTRIESPEGDFIDFNYSQIDIRTQLGPFQSVILKTQVIPGYPNAQDVECAGICSGQFSSVQYNKVDYHSYYLTSIEANNGQKINLNYDDRPDASGDNRLAAITIGPNDNERIIKKYLFEYQDFPIGDDLNQRFFLKKLSIIPTPFVDVHDPEVLEYKFDYNDPSTLASQESLLQDYYGYSKGNSLPQPQNFFPRPVNYSDYEFGYLGIDRTPDFESTKAGTLQKVTFPTGGYEEFQYEPHTVGQYQNRTDSGYAKHETVICTGINYNTSNTINYNFTPNNSRIYISYVTEQNVNSPANSYIPPDPNSGHFISYLEIWRVSDNVKVFDHRHLDYRGDILYTNLTAGVAYRLSVRVVNNSYNSIVNIWHDYKETVSSVPVNTTVCGLRVKQITAYEPITKKETNKYYTYNSLETPALSSGVGMERPSFFASYKAGGLCHPSNVIGETQFICPEGAGLLQVSSSSLTNGFTFGGSPVAYKNVIESDDPQFVNGCVEHIFSTYVDPQQLLNVLGAVIAGQSASGPFPDMNGIELETRIFKRKNNANIIIKKILNDYSFDQNVYAERLNYSVRKRWQPSTSPDVPFSEKMLAYDVNTYLYMSKWRHLNSTSTLEYDENGTNPIEKTVTYTYGNSSHLQPATITTNNSRDETVTSSFQYPADFNDNVNVQMVSKHILLPIIKTTQTNNGHTVSVVQNEYGGWDGNRFYKPLSVKIQKGVGVLEDRLRYYNYDELGNPLELSKEGDLHISYLWNYHSTYPVAEVKNASWEDIAYTSFEGDNHGGWIYDDNNVQQGGFTGNNLFKGQLTRAINTSKSFEVTMWVTDDGAATVNSSSGQLSATKGKWQLYKWEINNSNAVVINGINIDEVRLYPAGAEMATATYIPFVGKESECDINNNVVKYQYDGFNRLIKVVDAEMNILKMYDYKYQQDFNGCTDVDERWEETGVLRCVLAANLNFTGEQEKQEKNMNSCSGTYLEERWISIGNTGNCIPIANCDGEDKRVVNGICETGNKVIISSSKEGTVWHCMFKYVWSDGFETHAIMETQADPCVPVQ